MHQKCFIPLLIVSIGGSCLAWSQEDKYPDSRSATTIIEDRISVRDTDQVKVTSKPLQVRVDEDPEIETKNQKKIRTVTVQPIDNKDIPVCCGQKLNTNVSARSEADVRKSSSDNEREKHLRYGHYQDEGRYGWQSSSHPSGLGDNNGRHESYGGSYAGSQTTSDRYQRPFYNSENSNYGNNKANLNFGVLGGGKFGGLGDKFGGLGNKFGGLGGLTNKFGLGNKFGGLGDKHSGVNYGESEYGRPGYGGSSGYGDGYELGNQESGFGENGHPSPSHLATQQAVALKALAGVALIGAAAALATNPVLLPIGVISGRKKRDVDDHLNKESINFPLKVLKNYMSKTSGETIGPEYTITPHCVARLACEVQNDYITDLEKHADVLKGDKSTLHNLEKWFMSLIQKNILDADYVDGSMKKLIKLATVVGLEGRDCAVFICNMLES